MIQEEERVSIGDASGVQISKNALITILVCTGLSVFFMNAGFLSLFFLVPIGYAVKATGAFAFTFIIAAVSNIVISLIFGLSYNASGIVIEFIYFTLLFLVFIWIMNVKKLRTMYKFIIASSLGAIAFLILIRSSDVFNLVNEIITSDNVYFSEDPGIDAFLREIFTPDMVEKARITIYRFGAIFFHFFLFFISRQIALGLFWLIKRQRNDKGLMEFFAPANTIWILLGSFTYIMLLSKLFKNEILDIVVWNIFTICCIIFIAQGAGIIMFWLAQKSQMFRLAIGVTIIVLVFSPVVIFAIGAVLLLGVAGNFWQFRIQNKGQVSTPES